MSVDVRDEGPPAAAPVAGHASATHVVPPDCAGLRLDQALAKMLPEHSRSRLRAWIDAGDVTVDGHGVDAKRLEFMSRRPRQEYLGHYQRIDICLDTFPYNGHTTSLDAFWMGVPVVTLVGKTIAGRAGLCQAMNLDLPEVIAETLQVLLKYQSDIAKARKELDLDGAATGAPGRVPSTGRS